MGHPTATRSRVAFLAVMATMAATALVAVPAAASASACNADYVAHRSGVWHVRPTGGDDTANIQCALDEAAAAGPGAEVRLAAGAFHAGLLTATELRGGLSGAGPDRTTLRALPDLDCSSRIDNGRGKTWIYFAGGDVTVDGITFEVTDPTPCLPPDEDPSDTELFGGIMQFGGPGVARLADCNDLSPTHTIDAFVTDSAFRGPAFDPDSEAPAVRHGIWVSGTSTVVAGCPSLTWWPLSGTVVVQRSHFNNLAEGVTASGLVDGRLTVGGGAGNGNVFGLMFGGVAGQDVSGSTIVVSRNRMEGVIGAGTIVVQGIGADTGGYPVPALSRYRVRNNDMDLTAFADGVVIIDVAALITGEKSIDARISNNRMHIDSEFGGVFGLGAHDVKVVGNTFTGDGLAAVYHGVEGEPSGSWQITGNDVTAFAAEVAKVWLGTGSFDDLVVTMNPTDDVLDEGEGNTILGPGMQATAHFDAPVSGHIDRLLDTLGR